MFGNVILGCLLVTFISAGYDPVFDNVRSPSGADFGYDSRVEITTDRKLTIVNSIKNNAESPLAVKWEDGGMEFTLWAQVKPKAIATKKSTAQEPYVADHSQIRFGNGLQYSSDARCYVDGQARPKNLARTEFTQRNDKGMEVLSIIVSSELSDDGRSAILEFSVGANQSVILPRRFGAEINAISGSKGTPWEMKPIGSLGQLDSLGKDREEIVSWLEKTALPKNQSQLSDFVVLRNRSMLSRSISLTVAGSKWGLEQIYLAVVEFGKSGHIGLLADVYLPD